jgi:ABC-2 type transport system permease protein
MSDLLTLTRKEFREAFYNRSSLFRYYGFGLIFAVFFPLSQGVATGSGFVIGALLWVSYSAVITATGATMQAFYMEKMKRTIETLLATPLSDMALFGGKALFSFLLAYVGVWVAYAAQLIVFNLVRASSPAMRVAFGPLIYPGMAMFGLFVTLPFLLLYVVNIGTLISLKVANIRLANLMTMFSFVPLAPVLALFSPSLTWGFVLRITAFLLVVDAVVFTLAVRWFNREAVILSMP